MANIRTDHAAIQSEFVNTTAKAKAGNPQAISSGFALIGRNSAGPVSKGFPNEVEAMQWLSSGAAADFVLGSVQPLTKFVA